MVPYTLDNHFTFGYGNTLFDPKEKSSENQLWCKYSRASREPMSFRAECVQTAKIISEQAERLGRKPIIGLSGGLDSEVVVEAFIEAGVDFEILTFRFKNNLNSHELRFVHAFCQRHKLKPKYLDIDIHEWAYSEECKNLFNESQAASMNLLPHMKLMNHIWFELRGLPVLGNGDLYLENISGSWKYVELEYMLSWFRHAVNNGILGGIGFFQHTPEVVLSMLHEPKIKRLGRDLDAYATKAYKTSRFVKYGIYRQHWPALLMRPKFGGQEMVEDLFKTRTDELLEGRADRFIDKFVLSYDELRSMIEPNGTAYLLDEVQGPR